MAERQFPVRPNLEQLKHQAKDLLRADPSLGKLAYAQHALARSYGLPSWPRLVLACRLTDAIWRDDVEAVRTLVLQHPHLLHENARGVEKSNWGPPMSYAANLGRDRVIEMLRGLGATDLQFAFDRAVLQGKIATARQLYAMGARPDDESALGPCETQSGTGLAYLVELGAELRLEHVALILQTYSRDPRGKHQCLELCAGSGIALPDTAPMAVHRGRIDLLERHVDQINQTFAHEAIYPPALGCDADHTKALHGTPLDGGGLLHLAVDNDEVEIARFLLAHGADVNLRAAVGGHTPLFGCVVSQPYRVGLRTDDGFARMLLDHGADPTVRATLRKALRFTNDDTLHEYPDVTPLAWGQQFHDKEWVNPAVMQLLVRLT